MYCHVGHILDYGNEQEAAQALIYADMAGSKLDGIQDKVNEYLERVQALHNAGESAIIAPYIIETMNSCFAFFVTCSLRTDHTLRYNQVPP